jgi:hypothetical protein
MLGAMGRLAGIDVIEAAIADCRRAGIATVGSFFVGFPGETEQSVRRTAEFVASSGLDFASLAAFEVRDLRIPVLDPDSGHQLRVTEEGWAHETMTSSDAARYVLWAREQIATDPEAPLLIDVAPGIGALATAPAAMSNAVREILRELQRAAVLVDDAADQRGGEAETRFREHCRRARGLLDEALASGEIRRGA